jgi:hypothetical protein
MIPKFWKLSTQLYVCFADFKKAFDSIDRNALFQKIENKGIGGNFLKLIKDMYSNLNVVHKYVEQCGLKLSPCFTPRVVKNGSLYESPNLHEYNVLEYISLISLRKLPPMPSGYRTTDHIFILKTLINKYLHKLKSKLYVSNTDTSIVITVTLIPL